MPLKTDKALRVACPHVNAKGQRCGAMPGELCWDRVLGQQKRKAHWDRAALAKAGRHGG